MGLTHQKGTHWRPDEGKSFPARFSETREEGFLRYNFLILMTLPSPEGGWS